MIRIAALKALIASGILATCIVSITVLGYYTSHDGLTAKIVSALDSGAVSMPPKYDRNIQTGIDTFTDCLVLEIASLESPGLIAALSSATYRRGIVAAHPCINLRSKIGSVNSEQSVEDYWRYWWGSSNLIRIALEVPLISLPAYQAILKSACYITLFLIIGLGIVRYRLRSLPLLPVLLAVSFGFGIPLFGQSIAHAPSLIVGLIFIFVYMVARVDRMTLLRQATYAAIAGGAVNYFELMNGHILAVLMLLVLVHIVACQVFVPAPIQWRGVWPTLLRWPLTVGVITMIVAYVAGALSTVLMRIGLRSIGAGESILSIGGQWLKSLSARTGNNWDAFDLPADEPDMLRHLYYNIEVGTFPYLDRHATVSIYLACGLVYILIFVWLARHWRTLARDRRDAVISFILVGMLVPIWFAEFFNHTIVHFWMTGRLLSVFFALAISLAVFLIQSGGMFGTRRT